MVVDEVEFPWLVILAACFLISVGLVALLAYLRRPKMGVCTFCAASYSPSCPLVEGVSGTFLCKNCIVEMSLIAESKTKIDDLPTASDATSSTNPYASPTSQIFNRCGMCGGNLESTFAFGRNMDVNVCRNCISLSLELIRSREQMQDAG